MLTRFFRHAPAMLLTIFVLLAFVATAALRAGGYKILNVQSDSMQPSFAKGDAVLMRRIAGQQLQPGDVVTFRNQRDVILSHRLIRLDSTRLVTKGDAAAELDQPISTSAVEGTVLAVLPDLGSVISWLTSLPGLIFAIYLPSGIWLGRELRRYVAGRGIYRLG